MFSIITPSYNCADFIANTIVSVISQTINDWELIIVDDCSTDHSVEVIQTFVNQDSRIKLIQLSENSGAAVARNIAIKASQGRYIAFLDSDDLWFPLKLEKQLGFMQSTGCALSYTAYNKIDELENTIGHIGAPNKLNYSDLLKTCSIGCLTVVYDTTHFGKVFMPLIRRRQDYGLWLKLLKRVDFAYGINENLAKYRVRPNSLSANKATSSIYTWRLYRNIEKLRFLAAVYYFINYAVRGVFRHKFPALARRVGILH